MKILSNNRVKDLSCLFQYKIKAFLQIYLYFSLWFRSDNDKTNFLINIIIQSLKSYSCVENDYLEAYEITPDLLRKLAIVFYKNKLDDLQQIYNELKKELESLDKKSYDKELEKAKRKKDSFFEAKEKQRNAEHLTEEERDFYKYLKLFEKCLNKQDEQQQRNSQKIQTNIELDRRAKIKLKEKEEPERAGKLSAEEKRKAYQKKLEEKKSTTNEKDN